MHGSIVVAGNYQGKGYYQKKYIFHAYLIAKAVPSLKSSKRIVFRPTGSPFIHTDVQRIS